MAKIFSRFICQNCDYVSAGKLGRCPSCGEWESLVEKKEAIVSAPVKLVEVESRSRERIGSGIGEFDRVLGGGIVPGSVVLVAGEPGIGKSTLLLQLTAGLSYIPSSLYVSGEESSAQIKLRAERLKAKESGNLFFLAETNLNTICAQIEDNKPSLVVIDSIQTITSEEVPGTAGSITQVRESAHRLTRLAKNLEIAMFLIGHVTKEGMIAGPKVLEHIVDTVLTFEGERYADLRILRSSKNRFGSTEEAGIFRMKEDGLEEIVNPSEIFLGFQKENKPGSAVVCAIQGSRPILVEIQALTAPSSLPVPRRVANGVDFNRLLLMTAILTRHIRLPLGGFDIYLNAAGGMRIEEPAADLGICLAIVSSFKNKPLPPKTAAVGEVGLLGEIRNVFQMERRIKEAKKLGFANIISAKTHPDLASVVREVF